jgi:ubiquitin carboxyl-terminal hydrolase L3
VEWGGADSANLPDYTELQATISIKDTNMDAKSSLRQRKHFIPLESNPEVFNELIYKLGVPESLEFQDVLSLDDPDLLAFLPRPAYALVLVFPTTDAYQKRHDEEDSRLESYKENQADNGILFFRQTINNACGLYGILHSVCNGDVKSQIGTNIPPTSHKTTLTMLSAKLNS